MRTFYKIFFFCLLVSCRQDDNNGYQTLIRGDDFEAFLQANAVKTNSFKEIIIIPNVGCSSCISDAEKDFIKQYKNQDRLYIFTSISDFKLFKISLPNAALSSKNVIIDIDSKLVEIGFNSIYPSKLEKNKKNEYIANRY